LGQAGVASYAIASAGDLGSRVDGATALLRLSSERVPSAIPHSEHLERMKISGDPSERDLTAILSNLRRLANDDHIRGMFLQLDGLKAGWASLQEIRGGIARVRARGKKVFAYLISGGTRDYYVAAACDRIYLDAAGGLRLLGLSSSVMFFKDIFDK